MTSDWLKVLRFFIVGLINTSVDFSITNLLVLWLHPVGSLSLLLISGFAGICGMFCSFFLNRSWTFYNHLPSSRRREVALFFIFSALSVIVNTSTFLFFVKYLDIAFQYQGLGAINLAKLGGVIAGAFVSFFCYGFLVFKSTSATHFKSTFNFQTEPDKTLSLTKQVTILVVGAFLIRVVCFFLSSQTFQSSLLFSLIPGILIMIPIVWIAERLYGPHVSWAAGLLCAVHPRLITYSLNGSDEMIHLCILTTAIGCVTAVIQNRTFIKASIGWGICFALSAALRGEEVIFFFLTLPLPWLFSSNEEEGQTSFTESLVAIIAFLAVTGTLRLFCLTDLGNACLLYSFDGILPVEGGFFARIPHNLLYTLQRLPDILLSPIFLFALILPAFAGRGSRARGSEIPLFGMLLFPLIFYPLTEIDPHDLSPLIIPVNIFGAAGLYVLSRYLIREKKLPGAHFIYQMILGLIVIVNLATVYWQSSRL